MSAPAPETTAPAQAFARAFGMTPDELKAAATEFLRTVATSLVAEQPAPKLRRRQFSVEQTAWILNLPEPWLKEAARREEIPSRKCGRFRMFSVEDIEAIIEVCYAPASVGTNAKDYREIDRRRAKERAAQLAGGAPAMT